MTKKSDAPAIRFKGFSDAWEQRKFSDITFPAGEKNRDNLPLESYSITNEHGFVPQDEKFENGGTMREADKRMYYIVSPNSFAYNPARINVGSIGYQNIGKNVIVSSLYEVFKTSEDVDDRLLWHWLKSPDFQKLIMQLQEGGVRLYFYYDKLCMGEVSLPSLEEQRKIGKLFDTLDNLITLHQRQPFLHSTPEISLTVQLIHPFYTSSWEQRKFSELVQIERGGSPRPIDDFITDTPNGLNWIKIGDAPTQGNYITKTAEKIRPEGLSKTREVHPGDLILSNSMSFGKPYIMGIDGCIHDGWLLIRNTYGVFDLTFLCHLLGTPQMLSQYRSLAAGSTVNNLNKELVGNTVVTIPSITEQRVLGDYLEQLDNLITLHQRKCISFTGRAGRLISTVNKKRITSSWEQRKFDEVFDCTVPNNTLSRAELSYDEGTVLNVHYGDVLIKYGSVLDVQKDDIPRIPHRCREDFNGALLQDGDVIIADTAEDETTGKACEISNSQGSAIVSGLHTMVCRPRHRMALGYLGYYLNSNAYHHQLLPLMQGIKVLSLSRSNIQKTSVSYPIAVKEQQLIAYYFSQLDNLITLHQRKPFLMKWRNSDANRNQTNRLVL